MNHLTVDSHNESFHEVSQLPNVARPVVTHQNTHRFTRDAFEFSAMPLAEMLDQERDIFPSFSKRWELQWNDIQSVVQVLSKFSLVNERRNVTPRTLAACGFERRAVSPPRATQTASMLRTVQPVESVNQALSHYREGKVCRNKQMRPFRVRSIQPPGIAALQRELTR